MLAGTFGGAFHHRIYSLNIVLDLLQLLAIIISFTVQDQLYFEMDKKPYCRRTNAVAGLLSLYADDYVLCNWKAKEAKSGTILPTTALTGGPEERSESRLLWLADNNNRQYNSPRNQKWTKTTVNRLL